MFANGMVRIYTTGLVPWLLMWQLIALLFMNKEATGSSRGNSRSLLFKFNLVHPEILSAGPET